MKFDSYSPTQMLDLCKVDKFEHSDPNHFVREIMAAVILARNTGELQEKLKSIVESIGKVSIGQSLDRLATVAKIGPELEGDHTGLDALCYCLCSSSCTEGIKALQAVLDHFKVVDARCLQCRFRLGDLHGPSCKRAGHEVIEPDCGL